LAKDADTNVLSTPVVVTLDNEEAEIVVGQNVPFRDRYLYHFDQ
jgi:general secretion pathway protein D